MHLINNCWENQLNLLQTQQFLLQTYTHSNGTVTLIPLSDSRSSASKNTSWSRSDILPVMTSSLLSCTQITSTKSASENAKSKVTDPPERSDAISFLLTQKIRSELILCAWKICRNSPEANLLEKKMQYYINTQFIHHFKLWCQAFSTSFCSQPTYNFQHRLEY